MQPTALVQQALDDLTRVLAGKKHLAILMHNNPDPDALASALALHLLVSQRCHSRPTIHFSGFLSRAENRTMVTLLKIPVRRIDRESAGLLRPSGWILVDTQPGSTNHSLPPGAVVLGALDHHPRPRRASSLPFAVLDPGVGATSTLVTELLGAAGVRPTHRVASALYYGIRTDTGNLGRTATARDLAAVSWLFPLVRLRLVSRIEEAPLPVDHCVVLNRALTHARLHGQVVFTTLGQTQTSEPVSEVADYLARLEPVRWAIAGAWCKGDFYLSVRSSRGRRDAGALLRRLVGTRGSAGGHKRVAAARLDLAGMDPAQQDRILQRLVTRLIAKLGGTQASRALLGDDVHAERNDAGHAPLAPPGP